MECFFFKSSLIDEERKGEEKERRKECKNSPRETQRGAKRQGKFNVIQQKKGWVQPTIVIVIIIICRVRSKNFI